MKKLLVVAIAIVLSSCSQTNIAYIDVETVMNEYEAMNDLESEVALRQQEMASELEALQGPFQAKVEEYYKNEASMSSSKRAEAQQALQQEGQMIQSRQQQVSLMLQQENLAKSEVLIKKMDSVVAEYAKRKGFSIVLGTQGNGTVMYGNDNLNISSEIVTSLNENYSKK